MTYRIYHNPRCSKSRAALALLEDAGVEFAVVAYLDEPPSAAELKRILAAIDVAPAALIRTADAKKRDIAIDIDTSDADAVARLLAANPVLIERPIVVAPDGRAVLGRPPERISVLL